MKKSFIGTVVSTKMNQTAVVAIEVWKTGRIVKKRYKSTTRFLAHNPHDQFQQGQLVKIIETKPLSKHKHFIIEAEAKKEDK